MKKDFQENAKFRDSLQQLSIDRSNDRRKVMPKYNWHPKKKSNFLEKKDPI